MWLSRDQGAKWTRVKTLTSGGTLNHSYARKPLNAHPDFYALWADGDPPRPSKPVICFATRGGDVFALPERMAGPTARPEKMESR